MSRLKGTRTEKNLAAAFAGESMARNRYTFYASHAKKKGYDQIAALYLETAANELCHAKLFLKEIGGDADPVHIRTTITASKFGCTVIDNLKAAASGEHEEHTSVYPHFAEVAKQEGFDDIAELFIQISTIEAHHEQRFLKLAQLLESNTYYKRQKIYRWKARDCGYVHEGQEAPKSCPVCGTPQGCFEIQEVLE